MRRRSSTRLIEPDRRIGRILLGLGALLCVLVAANLLGFRLRPTTQFKLDVGFWGDQDLLQGVYGQESNSTGTTYRWAQAQSLFFVRDFAAAQSGSLVLDIGELPSSAGPTRIVGFTLDDTEIAVPLTTTARRYSLLLPRYALADGDLTVSMTSAASVEPPDTRALAFRLDDITLGWFSTAWALPTPAMLLAQAVIAVLWVAIGWRLELPGWSYPLIATVAVGLLAWSTSYKLMMAMAWQMRLLAFSAIVLLLVWNAYPLLERFQPDASSRRALRWMVGITVLAVAARVFAMMFPPFGSHDLYIHRDRLLDVQHGTLYLFDTPSEFADQRTTVPPAFYILASPFTLLTADPSVAIQGLYVLLEGTSALLVALFVQQIGGSPRATIIAGIVAALLPIQMTILWWGFGPQIVSQWLLLLLLVLLARQSSQSRALRLAAGLILTLALLTHNGAVVLGGLALVGYIALLWLHQRQISPMWLGWAIVLMTSSTIAVLLLYGEVLLSQLMSAQTGVAPLGRQEDLWGRGVRVWDGLRASFRPLGFALSSAGLLVLIRRVRDQARWLTGAWLGSALIFLAIDLAFGLQVRYAYFVVPLVCAGIGFALDWLMRWRILGTALTVALLALVCIAGLDVLFSGVFRGVKPTLNALTH